MRETTNGGDAVWMPRGRADAATKLGKLSALAASREWERAALIALLVKPGKAGRPRKDVTRNANKDQDQYTIVEFTRLGIYGFRTHNSVRAYLKAWALSGLAAPEWGMKVAMPVCEFPDTAEIYTLKSAEDSDDGPAPSVEPSDGSDDGEDEEEAEEAADALSRGRKGPSKPERTMLDVFLAVLDKTDPAAVLHGQPAEARQLLIKTLESWLDSLRDAASEQEAG